jgi:SNF2 family DNA or RNA helicase
MPLESGGYDSPDHIVYVAAGGRVADALTQDVLLAPIESSVIPLPHQIWALARAMAMDSIRYLLADEVGLGKTIETGLIIRELKLRGLVRRILVIAPKGLVAQWVSEMRVHFGETFHLVLPEDLRTLKRIVPAADSWTDESAGQGQKPATGNPWQMFSQVVVPMDSVKPLEKRRGWSAAQLAEYNRQRFEDLISAGWDLVIVDEAHRLGGSTDQVARFKLGRGLSEAAPYLLLLSATPHQGKSDAFHRLVSLLKPREFPDVDSVTRERVQPYVIRTEKRCAIDAEGQPLFKPRRTELGRVC